MPVTPSSHRLFSTTPTASASLRSSTSTTTSSSSTSHSEKRQKELMNLPPTPPSSPLALMFDSPSYWNDNFKPQAPRMSFPSFRSNDREIGPAGLFGYVDLNNHTGFLKAAERAIRQSEKLVTLVCNSTSPSEIRWTVKRLDRLSDMLCCVLDAAELIQNVHPDLRVVKAANQAHAALSNVLNQLNTNRGLYEALKRCVEDPMIGPQLSEEEKRVAHLLLLDFEKSGIHMPQKKREQFVDLNDKILELGQSFTASAFPGVSAVEIEKASVRLQGLSRETIAKLVQGKEDLAVVSTTSMSAMMVLKHVRDEQVRKLMYTGMNSATEWQVEILEKLLKTRGELASLLGKRSYADMYLGDKMARTPENVVGFLDSLAALHKPLAQADIARLAEIKRAHTNSSSAPPIHAWDRFFYAQFISPESSPSSTLSVQMDPFHHPPAAHHSHDPLLPYFPLGQTFAGLSNLLKAIYGVSFEPAPIQTGETWHEDVRKFHVIHEKEGKIGIVYCDLFRREQGGGRKFDAAAQFTIRCSRRIDDDEMDLNAGSRVVGDGLGPFMRNPEAEKEVGGKRYQLPIVVLVTGFARPKEGGGKSLLSLGEVETLFHEMGHVMHSMLARTDLQHIAGTRCPLDFVEVPSNFLENFARSPSVLSTFALHHQTGSPLPASLLKEAQTRSTSLSSLETQTQLQMALLDQIYHSPEASDPSFDSTRILRDLQARVNVLPYVEGTAWQVQFSHLFSYGASYYSYFWARRWSNRVYKKLFLGGGKSWREAGEMVKGELLVWGGGRDPWVGLEGVGVVREGERDGGVQRGELDDLGVGM
ncbi:Mitochondrial intermediate peptidase [Chytridiales sp. JEL 0842]|nr:Mitochondrial intermediate peptidase [Chytridiales sp. JEL 0842]